MVKVHRKRKATAELEILRLARNILLASGFGGLVGQELGGNVGYNTTLADDDMTQKLVQPI